MLVRIFIVTESDALISISKKHFFYVNISVYIIVNYIHLDYLEDK